MDDNKNLVKNKESLHRENQIENFAKGLNLVFHALFEFSKRASFKIGFGTVTFGLIYSLCDLPEMEKTLVSLGGFFILAKIGGLIDELVDYKMSERLKKEKLKKLEH